MHIELLTIGDEILIGHTVDANANWIAQRLSDLGMRLNRITVVGDNEIDIKDELSRLWQRSEVVFVTGGLGPTHDDITRPVLADFFNDSLEYREDIAESIRQRFVRRGMNPSPGYEQMAYFPAKAQIMINPRGSAPGIHYEDNSKRLFAMPGVPSEMQAIFSGYIESRLATNSVSFKFHLFRTSGIGESHLSEMIGNEAKYSPVKIAYLPSIDHGVSIRLSVSDLPVQSLLDVLDEAVIRVRERIEGYIFSEHSKTIEEVIIDNLRTKGLQLAIAESCTGGMICDRLISVPGCSDVFDRGYVTYSNVAKMECLGVKQETLDKFGAVSEQTALEMAIGTLVNSKADEALSVTGIAGPSGDSPTKPIGLTYLGYADKKTTIAQKFIFSGNRDTNRRRATLAALTLLWKMTL